MTDIDWRRIAGPLADRLGSPWTLGALALGLVTAAYTAWSVGSPVGWALAIVLPVLVLRFPVAGLLTVAVLTQEITSKGTFPVLTRLGNQVYYSHGKVPVLVLVALTAACAAVAGSWPRLARLGRLRVLDWILAGSAAGLVVLSAGIGLIQGQSPFSALNQNSRPFVLLLLGGVAGVALRFLPGESKHVRTFTGWALMGLVVAGVIAISLDVPADERISRYFIYYDAALPAVAAAVFIAVLFAVNGRWGLLETALLVTLPFLVLITFRRSVWLAALVVFLLALVVATPRWARWAARAGLALIATALVVLLAPGFAADLGQRSGAEGIIAAAAPDPSTATSAPTLSPTSPAAAQTSAPPASPPASVAPSKPTAAAPGPSATPDVRRELQEGSDRGHLGDLKLGWQYARANFWTGVGALSPQLSGLAADEATRIYVHNEILQVWLRYGLLGPLLVTLFFLAAGLKALRVLNDGDSDVVVRTAALFCLICPPCLMTAPFMSETNRWPVLIGFAAGVLMLWRPARVETVVSDATVEFPRAAVYDDATVEFHRPRLTGEDDAARNGAQTRRSL